MKAFFLSVFNGFFIRGTKKDYEDVDDYIFLTSTDPDTQRTLIIEGNSHAVWAYMLSVDKESIDFKGFLCNLVDRHLLPNRPSKNKDIIETFLPAYLLNQYSCVKGLKRKDIKIIWGEEQVDIHIKNILYMVMNLRTKMCYSKAISKDSSYGSALLI